MSVKVSLATDLAKELAAEATFRELNGHFQDDVITKIIVTYQRHLADMNDQSLESLKNLRLLNHARPLKPDVAGFTERLANPPSSPSNGSERG